MDQRGPKIVEGGKDPFSTEVEHQRGGKQAKVTQTLADKRAESQLVEADRDKKSVEAALDVVERQAKAQRKKLRQVEDDLSAARSQIKILTKKLEEAEEAKKQAEQERYEVGVAETEKTLRVEVVEESRECVLPPAIRASGSSGSKADLVSSGTNEGNESPTKALPTTNVSSKEAELSKDAKRATDITKEVAYDAALPPVAPKDPSKEKEASQSMEIVMATLPIPSKEELKGKG
ncbi:uncharacterized protein LOC111996049 [Quercus suber]|uniref:uncharacterized protein LOC111996049 n=1 Tax=Quercus suber TaxID=58331 RepID=UPI000CE1E582|nr:uncharacterized protein LOC111996049 [Quercus suber]